MFTIDSSRKVVSKVVDCKRQPKDENEFKLKLNIEPKVDELFLAWLHTSHSEQFFSTLFSTKANPSAVQQTPQRTLSDSTHEIPKFYFKNGIQRTPMQIAFEMEQFQSCFASHSSLTFNQFLNMMKQVCNFPSFIASLLFKKIDDKRHGFVQKRAFFKYWKDTMEHLDDEERVFLILKQNSEEKELKEEDLYPLIREILDMHSGLLCLKDTPEFQRRYAETVVVKIFYHLSRHKKRRITLHEFKTSALTDILRELDSDTDINAIDYFSYGEFYVIYLKFWELDTDHDLFLEQADLEKYSSYSLSSRTIARIFQLPSFTTTKPVKGKMSYQDFVWFILSEEDKTTETSIEYWFRVIDIDGDGILSAYEFQYFYEDQLRIMQSKGIEPVAFEDIYCQLIDMIKPKDEKRITLKDVKACQNASYVFNSLTNVPKFLDCEKDYFELDRESDQNDWKRFVAAEYLRACEEEQQHSQSS